MDLKCGAGDDRSVIVADNRGTPYAVTLSLPPRDDSGRLYLLLLNAALFGGAAGWASGSRASRQTH